MPRGVYDRSKAKPRTTHTTGRYRKRQIMTDVTTEIPATAPYSQFVEELAEQLGERDTQITMRLAEIETESDALAVEEAALTKEQVLVRDGIKALEK